MKHKFKFKFIIFICLSILLVFFIKYKITHQKIIANTNDIIQFNSATEIINGKQWLHISGLSTHSSFTVKSIKIYKEPKDPTTLNIIITLITANKDLNASGTFDQSIEIPENINTVSFGPEKKVIWIRN